jgi:hypothetical protein
MNSWNSSELFLVFVRRAIFAFFVILLAVTAGHAQESGHVGITTREIPVFTNQGTSKASAIFIDQGYAANYLTYCDTNFVGSIDLEWSPPITGSPSLGPFIALAQASYGAGNADSSCHTLQVGGYFPNLRSTLTITGGSVSAWYTASAAPIALFAAGVGSNGPASPVVCDQSTFVTAAAGVNVEIVGPTNFGDTVIICGFSISFDGATSAGMVEIGWAASAGACAASPVPNWWNNTTSSTPQTLVFPMTVRSFSTSADPLACFVNSSGAIATVQVSYASVHGL